MTRVRTGEAPSVDAVEAVEIRARATLEDARRIAVAEGRDEIALNLRSVGEEGRVDRSIVEARHRTGIETERASRAEAIGAMQARVATGGGYEIGTQSSRVSVGQY